MLFYDLKIDFKASNHPNTAEEKKTAMKEMKEALFAINEENCGQNEDVVSAVLFYRFTLHEICAVFFTKDSKNSRKEKEQKALELLKQRFCDEDFSVSACSEISLFALHNAVQKATGVGLLARWAEYLPFTESIYGNDQFRLTEYAVSSKRLDKKRAFAEAKKMMPDRSLLEELDRIYDPSNKQVALSHPVHYKIIAGSEASALEIVKLVSHALYEVKRVSGRRIHYIDKIRRHCWEENELNHIFKYAPGTVIAIETGGEYSEGSRFAIGYESVADYLQRRIELASEQTLFFLVELADHPGFCRPLISRLAENMNFVEIREGTGTVQQAVRYMKSLIKASRYGFLETDGLLQYLPDQKTCRVSDVYDGFEAWKKDAVKQQVYPAYNTCEIISRRLQTDETDAQTRLKKMIGLQQVKQLAEEITATYRVMELRKEKGLSAPPPARHMMFTGNPGSAKTTVARLLARIFADEGILKKHRFVECGRGDLVGQYVGWTAKQVEQKFEQARGGMLFIDEAYALVEEKGLYGDEAIHTIVQQMENLREEVVVVFAGYKEKMNEFLEKNEGLRSRIAFHLDFPDYNPDELTDILKLMAKEQQFDLSEGAVSYSRRLFEKAVRQKDFGNGRYVRNVFEQAKMRQANRITRLYAGRTLTNSALRRMEEDDFRVALTGQETTARVIGF